MDLSLVLSLVLALLSVLLTVPGTIVSCLYLKRVWHHMNTGASKSKRNEPPDGR